MKLGIHNRDARDLVKILDPGSVNVTVTSPPYYDLKNYNHPDQIGYGQTYEEYLDELEVVFKAVHKVTKNTGSLWVVIDMFKKEGVVVPLPFDFVNRIKAIGWKLQEVIIWEKDRTVPWAHNGQVRNSFEYILVFSKSTKFKFHIERIKTINSLKKWWVRYPERYNPRGKSPDGIWHFPIPTQGSWGKGYIRHFCPLPEDLITQILTLTTDQGDVVLDPFAGSGAVLSRAANMKRKYVGFELNSDYIEMFEAYVKETGKSKLAAYEAAIALNLDQEKFQETILNLRVLKFVRVMFQHLAEEKKQLLQAIFVPSSRRKSKEKHKLLKTDYHLLVGPEIKGLAEILKKICDNPPLSKYGIEPNFIFHSNLKSFTKQLKKGSLYVYTLRNTHSFEKEFVLSDLTKLKGNPIFISEIKLEIDENRYE